MSCRRAPRSTSIRISSSSCPGLATMPAAMSSIWRCRRQRRRTRKPPTAGSSPTSRSTPSTCHRRARPTGASSAQPARHSLHRAWQERGAGFRLRVSRHRQRGGVPRRKRGARQLGHAGIALINGDTSQTFAVFASRRAPRTRGERADAATGPHPLGGDDRGKRFAPPKACSKTTLRRLLSCAPA